MSRDFLSILALPVVAAALWGGFAESEAAAQTTMTVPFNHSFNIGKHHGSPIVGINLNAPITGVFGNGNGVGVGGIGGSGKGVGGSFNGNTVSPYPYPAPSANPYPGGWNPYPKFPSGPQTGVWGNGNGVGVGGYGPGIGYGGHGNGNIVMLPY